MTYTVICKHCEKVIGESTEEEINVLCLDCYYAEREEVK